MEDDQLAIPVAKMERHPLFSQFYSHIKGENGQSVLRTKARLLMKRFVFDVHEVWLTNLQHLREHQPARLLKQADADISSKEGSSDELESAEEQGHGLSGRRDSRAIESMEAQIQSVSQKKALEKAYFTTRMPDPKVVLNYEPADSPSLVPARSLPPDLEHLVEGLSVRTSDHDKSSSIDPNNSKAHITHVSLFVERLLPSSDRKQPLPGQIHGDVLWRLTAYRREDVRMLCYVTTESEIQMFYDKLISSSSIHDGRGSIESKSETDNNNIDNNNNISYNNRNTEGTGMQVVYETPEDVDLPWAVMDLSAFISISVGPKRSPSGESGENGGIQVKILCELKADYDGEIRELILSPIELRYMLQMPTVPLSDIVWWSDPAREGDVWASLIRALFIVDGAVNEFGDPEPENIWVTCEKTPADSVPGAMTTARSLAVAQEILSAVIVDSQLNLTLTGSHPNMFLNMIEVEETQNEYLEAGLASSIESKEADYTLEIDHSKDPDRNMGSLIAKHKREEKREKAKQRLLNILDERVRLWLWLYLYNCGVLYHVEWCIDSSGFLLSYLITSLALPMTTNILISTLKHEHTHLYLYLLLHLYLYRQEKQPKKPIPPQYQ